MSSITSRLFRVTDPLPTLAQLIREHQDATGDSYGDIARRTNLSKAKIGQLAQEKNRYLVRTDTLRKLATGLHIPIATVERAALGTAGYADEGVQQDSTLTRIIERLYELDDDDLELVAALVEAVSKHRR
jgi:transcriptional regulator with XRE-family HTH domain